MAVHAKFAHSQLLLTDSRTHTHINAVPRNVSRERWRINSLHNPCAHRLVLLFWETVDWRLSACVGKILIHLDLNNYVMQVPAYWMTTPSKAEHKVQIKCVPDSLTRPVFLDSGVTAAKSTHDTQAHAHSEIDS